MSLVVIGTDTEVGKTVVSAILLARYGRAVPLGYWKPIASGASEGSDTDDVGRWCGHLADVLPPRYIFDAPVSPHLAARLERRRVTPDAVLEGLVEHATNDPTRSLIVEGIGGLLVPITDDGYLLSHLLAELHLPCLLVARSTLGTINHTLLTLEALRQRDIELAGVVLNGPRNQENRRAIESFGHVQVVAEVEPLPRLGRAAITKAAKRFDRRARLKLYLG
jgi:dethiobiotin synthase